MPALNVKEVLKNGELDLSSMGLKEIPLQSLVSHAKHITSLNVSNNKITSISKGIGQLTNLVKLDASKNQLKGLPECIGHLPRLEHLNLSNNQLGTLPSSLPNLRRLKYVDLRNNALAPKFAKVVASSANGGPQQTARNILKGFNTPTTENDKNKKKEKEEITSSDVNKKKKNADKNPANGLNQVKQKNKKKSKKPFLNRASSSVLLLVEYIVYIAIIGVLSLYALSFYNEPLFVSIKNFVGGYWNKCLALYFNEDTIFKINDGATWLAIWIKSIALNCVTYAIYAARKAYTYITTDETVQLYLSNASASLNQLWLKVAQSYQKFIGQTTAAS